ncbi:hypothetical protein NHL50_05545 [Acidimicrobiia bacterium EGI L10123]|uniref:hypothetical protein n=1 Tax=Salinilacustrithrix flava TaxID=2957203 RepID=UPI003D7C3656|nr:hypothetical protein [Acidimicrobiia bacterium EGI L10123]
MHHLTRRTLATTVCAGALLFGAGACGDDDTGVDVDIDEEQVEENLDETGEDISEGLDDAEDTIDENLDVEVGDDAEGD